MENSPISASIARVETLPTLPAVLARILSTAADPGASALDLARHISADPALTATLLRIVNSAFYGFKRRIDKITEAIVILGFTEVRNLALAATAFGSLPETSSAYDRTQLWRHSIAAAIAADRCAKTTGIANPDTCFVAGLLHDIGKVVFDVLDPENCRRAALHAHSRRMRIAEAERQLFQYDHTGVGAALGRHWNLPAPITQAIQHHHAAETRADLPETAKLTAVANALAYSADLGEASSGVPPAFPAGTAQALGISEEQHHALENELRNAAPRIEGFIGAIHE